MERPPDAATAPGALPSGTESKTPDPSVAAQSLVSVGRGATTMVLGTATYVVLQFVVRVGVARSFSVATTGEFFLGLALVSFLSQIAPMGLAQASAQVLSHETDPRVRRATVRAALLTCTGTAVGASVAVFLLASSLAALFHSAGLTIVFQFFSVTVGFTVLSLLLTSFFQGFERAGPNAFFNLLLTPLLLVISVGLAIALRLGFYYVLVGYAVSTAVTFLLLVAYTVRRLPKLIPTLSPEVRVPAPKRFWSLSVSLWGVNSLSITTLFADTLILGVFHPPSVVGIYASSVSLARLLLVGYASLGYIFLPVAARLHREGQLSALRATYAAGTRWTFVVSLPLFLLFAFMPQFSMGSVFGARYVSGGETLQVLAVGAFASTLMGPANACMAGMGRGRALLGATGISAVANVVLSFVLIPPYGALGAASAWTIARLLFPLTSLLILYRAHRITPFSSHLTRPLLLSLVVGVPLFLGLALMPFPAWFVVPLFLGAVGLCLGAILLTRSIDSADVVFVEMLEATLHRPLPRVRAILTRFQARNPPSI